jgi:adenylate cyclase
MGVIETLKRRRRRFYRSLAIGFAIAAFAFIATDAGYYDGVESKSIDLYFKFQSMEPEWLSNLFKNPGVSPICGGDGSSKAAQACEIVIVAVDDDAFARLNERQPLPRWYLAELINAVSTAGAKVIGYDLELTVATETEDDERLVEAIKSAADEKGTKVVLSYAESIGEKPESIFGSKVQALTGFVDITPDSDEVLRVLPLALESVSGRVRPSFALAVVSRYSNYGVAELETALNHGKRIYLDLREWDRAAGRIKRYLSTFSFGIGDHWKIDFSGGENAIKPLPSDFVYDLYINKSLSTLSSIFRDKIVLIGGMFKKSGDRHPTPFDDRYGIEIHARAIDTILARAQIHSVRPVGVFLVLAVFAILASLALTFLQSGTVNILTYVFVPILFIGSYLSLRLWGLWIDLVTPVLAMRIGSEIGSFLEERSVRRALRKFVNQEVADPIMEEESIPAHKTEATVFFTDVRDFTTICETWAPAKIVSMMNDLYSMIGEVLRKHKGCVIDFVGDGVFAVFGVSKTKSDHAANAVAAALEIQERMDTLNSRWQTRDLPALRIGIGIHTGEVLVDILGSSEQKKFSVTGDAVNVGARVEALNKEFLTSVLITGDTAKHLDDRFEVTSIGNKQLKGRNEPEEIFKVIDTRKEWRFAE